ncbi:MAG: hypothetical protein R3E31_06675 [Chloroflexota bacterium]
MMGALQDVKALDLDGIPALTNTAAAQAYPLSAPLYFVSLTEPQGELRASAGLVASRNWANCSGERYGRIR